MTNKGSSHAGTSFLHGQKALLSQEFCLFHNVLPIGFLHFRWFMFFKSRLKTAVLHGYFFNSVLFLDLSFPVFYEIWILFYFTQQIGKFLW